MRSWVVLLVFASTTAVANQAQEPQDCHQCYSLVKEAVDAHRVRLQKLQKLLLRVTSSPAGHDDRRFEVQLSLLTAIIEDLYNDARRAVIRDSSPLELLGDLQERIEEVKKVAGSILVYIELGRVEAEKGEQTISEAQIILRRIDQTLRETMLFLQGEGADALQKAIEQSKNFGLQSAQMSEIARQAGQLADEHVHEAGVLDALAQRALSNASAAYNLAYLLLEQQRNFTGQMTLLDTGLSSTEALVVQTHTLAEQARRDAMEAYDSALSIYTMAQTSFAGIDVNDLKRRADFLLAEARRMKADLEAFSREHGPLVGVLEKDVTSIKILMERGLSQQQWADELMFDVTAARDKAILAVSTGEATLEEARRTLDTLLGFDRQVQESRALATAALRQVEQIQRMVEEAERRTVSARAALHGAEKNAGEARDIAANAEAFAEEAHREATSIQSESSETKIRAGQLRDEARWLNGEVSDTSVLIERYEEQLVTDSALAREALEKANQAKSNAADASARVDAALRLVREIMAALAAAGELDTSTLDRLERRLAAAEADLTAAQLEERLSQLQSDRIIQNRMVRSYEEELAFLRGEVTNIQDIADALPDGCYARVKLEP